MKNSFTILVMLVVAALLLSYMSAFQVRYDQVAVVTTFGHAKAPKYNKNGAVARDAKGNVISPGSLKFQPGLYFKWPWPIQEVEKYPTQVQILKNPATETLTSDGNSVDISTYLAWKIQDPSAFFRSLATIANAKMQLQSLLQNVNHQVIGSYPFSQLVNNDAKQLRIHQIEEACANKIQDELSQIKPGYGIKVVQFGIRRMVLPEKVTTKVFARMRATREALAQNLTSEGKAQALNITSKADSQKQRILAFANREAQALRTQGDRQAAMYYGAFKKDQQFAIFLREMQSLKDILPNNTTFIMNAKDLGPMNLLDEGTKALFKVDQQVKVNQNKQPSEANSK